MIMEIDALTTGLLLFLLAGMFEARIKLGKLKVCFDKHIESNRTVK